VSNGSGISRGQRNRSARLGRLRELVPVTNAVGIDLAEGFRLYVAPIRLSQPAHSRSRSTNFWILPVDVLGSGPNSIVSGHL
jgi:transposase